MNTLSNISQGLPEDPMLSIGDLADRTGVSPATIRMWETRHGFPRPARLDSGHRRYAESDVAALSHVVQRRDAGVRLDVAIAEAVDALRPSTPSVFAELRRRHVHLDVQRLRKPTLLALSWAIEDEFCARADRAHIFGAFQHERRYLAAEERWVELDRVAESAFVFADFPSGTASGSAGPVRVPLAEDAPMRREWAVVCDSVDLPIALTAWEIPGQGDVPQAQRVFESIWTVDPAAVRDAARVCLRIASEAGVAEAAPVAYQMAGAPMSGRTDLASVTSVFNRVVSYVDRFGAPS